MALHDFIRQDRQGSRVQIVNFFANLNLLETHCRVQQFIIDKISIGFLKSYKIPTVFPRTKNNSSVL